MSAGGVSVALAAALTTSCSVSLPPVTSLREDVPAACSGVSVKPGDAQSVQHALDTHPAGTTFCFIPGLYRFTKSIAPKSAQRLIAPSAGTVLNGSKVVRGFAASDSGFVASGFLQGGHASSRNCIDPNSGCDTPQDVFVDGRPLRRVTARSRLAKGTFFEDFQRNQIWLHDDPAGHVVEQAFATALVESGAGGIVISGFVVEEAATAAQYGAISALNYAGRGWRIERNTIQNNHAAGILLGPRDHAQGGSVVAYNRILGNGQEGITGYGSGHIVTANEIARNNRVGYSCYWECGGAKFGAGSGLETENLSVTKNDVHDNYGDGLWVDINSYNVTFAGNRIVRNEQTLPGSAQRIGAGILVEISDRAHVTNNDVEDNGPAGTYDDQASYYQGAQILISATANVAVENNRVAGAGGIGMLQQDRPDSCRFGASHLRSYPDGTPVCPQRYRDHDIHWTHDNAIHGNHVEETVAPGYAEAAGLDCDLRNDAVAFSPRNANLYDRNTYRLKEIRGSYFSWKNRLNASQAWRAFGQDARSRFLPSP